MMLLACGSDDMRAIYAQKNGKQNGKSLHTYEYAE